jgi:hypothetical protein
MRLVLFGMLDVFEERKRRGMAPEQMMNAAKLIVYACPTGTLADQIDAFYTVSRERFGPNSAHAYPPHITLTGFFHDDHAAVGLYTAALDAARGAQPQGVITISELLTTAEFHGLLIASPWLEALTADFAARAHSPTRRDALRVKRNLHLSLAYGFASSDGSALGDLACSMVDPAAPAGWALRLYERRPDATWVVHAEWGLETRQGCNQSGGVPT